MRTPAECYFLVDMNMTYMEGMVPEKELNEPASRQRPGAN